jgi:hypothetical protein
MARSYLPQDRFGRDEGREGYDGNNGARGIVVVKNNQEWLESRKKLKERKKRGSKEGRASDEPAAFGFPMGGIEEQIERLLGDERRRRGGAGDR